MTPMNKTSHLKSICNREYVKLLAQNAWLAKLDLILAQLSPNFQYIFYVMRDFAEYTHYLKYNTYGFNMIVL